MATSSIKVYVSSANWKLLPNKLFVVENIESYLSNQSVLLTNNSFQYIKHELELSITIPVSQTYIMDNSSVPVYVSIKNSGTGSRTYYYFVKNRVWRGQQAIRLDLVMDVLNSFTLGTDYTFKNNCNILREHKDRFYLHEDNSILTLTCEVLNEDWYPDVNDEPTIETYPDAIELGQVQVLEADTQTSTWVLKLNVIHGDISGLAHGDIINIISENNQNAVVQVDSIVPLRDYFRKIDYVEENINPVLYCGDAVGTKLEVASPLNVDWYLLYRNQNDPDESLVNPVDCYLVPSASIPVVSGLLTSGSITAGALENNKYYYLNLRNSGITLSNGVSFGRYIYYNDFAIVKKQDNGLLSVSLCSGGVGGTYDLEDVVVYNDIQYITLEDLPQAYSSTTTPYDVYTYISTILGNEVDSWTGTEVEQLIDNVASIDKTDAKNIKLIKLPYVPYNFVISSGRIDLTSSNWNYESLTQADNTTIHLLKLYDMRTKLENSFTNTSITPFDKLLSSTLTPSQNESRLSMLDSKMYHSEFYRPTMVYDSFNFVFQLEKCDLDYYISNIGQVSRIICKFVSTSTINSKFMMKFTSYKMKMSSESYNNVMPIAINNEEVLYNVPYINYVRTGFNYDVKNKNISTSMTWAGVGASALGMAVSFALPSVPLKVAGIVSSAIGMAVSIANAIATTKKNEMSLEQKIKEQKLQATSVMGSDDVDLRSEYTENRFKYLVYKPSPVMEGLINDLFYYSGYASNRMGTPNTHTRINFDYLQADISLNLTTLMEEDMVQELINMYKTGITFIHRNTNRSGLAQWDMDQTLENWEISLVGD